MYIIRKIFNGPKTPLTQNVTGKVIIVTGASEGIGEEIALQLLKNDATVIFACKNEEKFERIFQKNNENSKLKKNAFFIKINLSDFSSVKNFYDIFSSKFQKLDILINNAAVINKTFKQTAKDKIEETLQVNTFSPMLLTEYLKAHLQSSNGKVINLTGKIFKNFKFDKQFYSQINPDTYDLGKQCYSALDQYAFSKLGNFYFTKHLDKKWFIKFAVVHPGVIMTKISRNLNGFLWNIAYLVTLPLFILFAKSKFMGAQAVLHLCYAEGFEFMSGEYYENNRVCAVNKEIDDEENMNEFIEFSKRIINYYGKANGISFNG
jgi:NAD(P)-dependent dehydrogenase (short-subunit alcohol dehydrogenase family)